MFVVIFIYWLAFQSSPVVCISKEKIIRIHVIWDYCPWLWHLCHCLSHIWEPFAVSIFLDTDLPFRAQVFFSSSSQPLGVSFFVLNFCLWESFFGACTILVVVRAAAGACIKNLFIISTFIINTNSNCCNCVGNLLGDWHSNMLLLPFLLISCKWFKANIFCCVLIALVLCDVFFNKKAWYSPKSVCWMVLPATH